MNDCRDQLDGRWDDGRAARGAGVDLLGCDEDAVATEHAGSAAATMSEDMTKRNKEPSAASAGYAVQPRLIERAFREVIESVNEASRSHAINYAGLITALLAKGVISVEELEAGRQQAKPLVDGHFGPTPEQKRSEELAKLLNALGRNT